MQRQAVQRTGPRLEWGDAHAVPSMERSASPPELEQNPASAQQLRMTVAQNTN